MTDRQNLQPPAIPKRSVPPPPPQSDAASAAPSTGEEVVATVIPYRNPAALAAYYLGVFSVIPVLGFFAAIPAFILGIFGFRAARRMPTAHGTGHALVGLLVGGLSIVGHMAVAALVVYSASTSS